MESFKIIEKAEKEIDEALKNDEYYQDLSIESKHYYRNGRIQMNLANQIK